MALGTNHNRNGDEYRKFETAKISPMLSNTNTSSRTMTGHLTIQYNRKYPVD